MGPKRTFQHGGPTPPPLWAGRSPPRPARPGSGCPGRSWPRVRSGARDSEDLVRCGGRGRCCAAGPGELVRGAGRVGPTEPAASRLRAGLELSSVPCPRRAGGPVPAPSPLPASARGYLIGSKNSSCAGCPWGRSGFGGAKGKALLEGFHVSFRYTRSCVAGWLGILEPCLPEGVGLARFALSLRARLSCVSCSLSRRWAALSRVLHFWALR